MKRRIQCDHNEISNNCTDQNKAGTILRLHISSGVQTPQNEIDIQGKSNDNGYANIHEEIHEKLNDALCCSNKNEVFNSWVSKPDDQERQAFQNENSKWVGSNSISKVIHQQQTSVCSIVLNLEIQFVENKNQDVGLSSCFNGQFNDPSSQCQFPQCSMANTCSSICNFYCMCNHYNNQFWNNQLQSSLLGSLYQPFSCNFCFSNNQWRF